MFTQDIVKHYGFHDRLPERHQVLSGRVFVLLLLGTAYALSQVTGKSIFSLGIWSLSGFVSLFPSLLAALYWKRSTKTGVVASALTVAVLWILFYRESIGSQGLYTIGGTGLMPVGVMLPAATIVLVVVSLLTRPPAESVLKRFFEY